MDSGACAGMVGKVKSESPEGVDSCGERGEFHSFVYAGPVLSHALSVSVGETVVREQFVFTDLIPG